MKSKTKTKKGRIGYVFSALFILSSTYEQSATMLAIQAVLFGDFGPISDHCDLPIAKREWGVEAVEQKIFNWKRPAGCGA
ncbi:MAG: hypothetical protein R2911_02530 [Caldilineaceae bacterium]